MLVVEYLSTKWSFVFDLKDKDKEEEEEEEREVEGEGVTKKNNFNELIN